MRFVVSTGGTSSLKNRINPDRVRAWMKLKVIAGDGVGKVSKVIPYIFLLLNRRHGNLFQMTIQPNG